MNALKRYYAVLLIFLLPYCVYSSDIKLMGNVDSFHAASIKNSAKLLSSRTQARVDSQIGEENCYGFVSFKAEKNNVVESETGFLLREAYAEYAGDHFGIKAGRQLIIWGKAEGFQITDTVCSKDYTEYLARDFDEMRIAVDGVKASFLYGQFSIQLVWIPVFEKTKFPGSDSPWHKDSFDGYVFLPNNSADSYPDKKITNSEGGLRISLNAHKLDFSVSCFHSWDDSPSVFNRGISDRNISGEIRYNRITFAGAEISFSPGDFVLRAEGAIFHGRYYERNLVSLDPVEKNNVRLLGAVDYTPGSNWTFSCQVYDDLLLDYDTSVKREQHCPASSLRVEKKLFREELCISGMIFGGLNYGDSYSRLSIDYSLADGFHILAGGDYFAGDKRGDYGRYSDNSQYWIRGKYSF